MCDTVAVTSQPYRIVCKHCFGWFWASRRDARTCSSACRRARARRAAVGRWFDDTSAPHPTRGVLERVGECAGPGCDRAIYNWDRVDKRYCSDACRKRASRASY